MNSEQIQWGLAFGFQSAPTSPKVFVVSAGKYDNWRIVAIFTTADNAADFVAKVRPHLDAADSFNEVEEWCTDPEV